LFEKKDASNRSLKDEYKELYIFGFCNADTGKFRYANIIDTNYLVKKLAKLKDCQPLVELLNTIHQHAGYPALHPWEDETSLRIMLDTINRSAIRHSMRCEGSISDMLKGLSETVELITKGSINNLRIASMPNE
jgi:hypothetical protein